MTDFPDLSAEEPDNPLPEVMLETLPDRLRAAVEGVGWTSLMPVQAKAIPYLLEGRDMIVQARTGSGKTGGFLLPMLERLDPEQPRPQALVLVPTRELARQVADDAEALCIPAGFKSAVVYGGAGYKEQIDALKGGAQIVIGTPGRVLDHLLKRTLSLEHLKLLVFDEADRMLSMGFYPDMKRVQRYLPERGLQSCMFSATFPGYVLRTAREFLHEPGFLSLCRGPVHVTDIEHLYYEVPGMEKERTLVRLIELENPAAAIIFCNTKMRVHYVTVVLQRMGYDADELSADLSQKDRERVLGRIRGGTLRFLVATDVAARGLDLPELSHVFQYELPEDPEAYIHRAGRTGRAGASGIAISLVNTLEKLDLNRIRQRHHVDIQERPLPTDEDVEAVVSQRLTAILEARLRERDKLQTERSLRFLTLARTLAESEDESAIIAMLLDEYYQQSLHAPLLPPDVPAPKPAGKGAGRGATPPAPRQPSAAKPPRAPSQPKVTSAPEAESQPIVVSRAEEGAPSPPEVAVQPELPVPAEAPAAMSQPVAPVPVEAPAAASQPLASVAVELPAAASQPPVVAGGSKLRWRRPGK